MIQKIKEFFYGKESLPYPRDFAIIDWSSRSQELGVKGMRNKIITRYFRNTYGNVEIRKYPFSEQRVYALQEIHRIPIYDKTRKASILPVFSKILPNEARYLTR